MVSRNTKGSDRDDDIGPRMTEDGTGEHHGTEGWDLSLHKRILDASGFLTLATAPMNS